MSALVLTGNLTLSPHGDPDTTVAGDEITELKISATVDSITVPQTMTTDQHARGGAADFSVTLSYLSNDEAGSLFRLLWSGLGSSIVFTGSMRDESVSSTNPSWTGEFIVTEASLGAAAAALSTGSATFPMIGAPVRAVS